MKKLTRKEQRVKSQREYERKMALLDKQLKAAQKKTRKDLAQLRKQVREEKKRVERITYKELVRKGVDGAPIKPLLQQLSRNLRTQATKEIITGRMNRAAHVYDDVRTEAWDIAEDLDWDISEVFNAWEYDDTA